MLNLGGLRPSEKSQLIFLGITLFMGVFFWRVSFNLKQQAEWKPATQEALQHFRVVAFLNGEPSIVPLLQVPQGDSFYFEPESEDEYIRKLQERGDVVVDLSDRSQSSAQHRTTLELYSGASVRRYYYQAGRETLSPLGWSQVGESDLTKAAGDGLIWALGALVAAGLFVLAAHKATRR